MNYHLQDWMPTSWKKALVHLSASLTLGFTGTAASCTQKPFTQKPPQSVLSQLSYLPENIRSNIITEMKTEPDWDMDGVPNGQDVCVLDPTNEIAQPKYETISFIRGLKKQNKSRLLPQAYNRLVLTLYTVDSNPQFFQETTPVRAHATAKLVDGIDSIAKYPRALSLAATEAESQKLTDDKSMNSFVVPAVGYIVRLQDERKIDVLNGLNVQDME